MNNTQINIDFSGSVFMADIYMTYVCIDGMVTTTVTDTPTGKTTISEPFESILFCVWLGTALSPDGELVDQCPEPTDNQMPIRWIP